MTVWDDEDLPFLRALVEMDRESEDGELPFPAAVAQRAGLAPQLGAKLTERLYSAGYISASIMRNGSGAIYGAHITGIGERARRVTGQWPSQDPVVRMLQLLEDLIASEPDEDRRSKLEKLRHALVEGSKNVGSNVLANLIVLAGTGVAGG